MYSSLLIVHVFGALATGALAIAAITAVIVRAENSYRRLVHTIALLAAFEVGTGTLLAVFSADITVISVCDNIALYVASVACIEAILFMRMKDSHIRFPFMQTLSPIGLSVVLLLSGLAFGL